MVDYTSTRRPNIVKTAVLSVAAVALFGGGIAADRFLFPQDKSAVTPSTAPSDTESCERGDDALAAAAAGQLAELVAARVKGEQATQEVARTLGATPEVVATFGTWANQETSGFTHAFFGPTAFKIGKKDGDRVTVSVDGFWLRSPDAANAGGEFLNALWIYTLVWREGRWVPAAVPEATTLPGATTNRALPFIRIKDGYSGVPYVRC